MYRPGQDTQQNRQTQQGQQYSEGGSIGQAAPLGFPVQAILDETGEPVTLIQTCDWPGHSPSNVGVDKHGKQFVASFSEVTIVDQRVLPNDQALALLNRSRR